MKQLYLTITAFCISLLGMSTANAQCAVDVSVNGVYGFNAPGGGIFSDFLCIGTDSVGTTGVQGYYDGDGYQINLIAGTQVTFEVSACTGSLVSLTVVDSLNTIISGAYSAAACSNSVNFTATYTGTYVIVMNVNGVCAGGGTSLIGQVHVKIISGTTVPNCLTQAYLVNDTICGALALTLDGPFLSDNTANSYPTDPIDGDIVADFVCSAPNNTMWYSYSPANNVDTLYAIFATTSGDGFHGWLGVFQANDPNNACAGGITYINCLEGPDDGVGNDTVSIPITGLAGGETYYLMIDGFSGSVGPFGIRLESSGFFNSIASVNASSVSVYPNPASTEIFINTNKSDVSNSVLTLTNALGQVVYTKTSGILSLERIDISSQPAGIYILRISGSNGNYDKKIVVR